MVFSGIPTGQIPALEDMTGAALFLASDDANIAGSYMIADMLGA